MVGGLTAILRDDHGPSASVRLNVFEFAGMLGVLGGLAWVGMMPAGWSWPVALLAASTPVLVPLAITPILRRRSPAESDHVEPARGAPGDASDGTAPIVWLMFGIGALMALAWASVSQFLVPLRGAREFGLDRGGVSMLLATSHVVDLAALLPVGWLADRVGRLLVLG